MEYKGYKIIAEVAVNWWCDIELDEERGRVELVDYISDGGPDKGNITGYVVVDQDDDPIDSRPDFDHRLFDGLFTEPPEPSKYQPWRAWDLPSDPPYAGTLEDAKKIIDRLVAAAPADVTDAP